jgi:predicted nucleic acid-binding protein
MSWRDAAPVVETSPDTMLAAADLATDHHLGSWDAVILSAASRSG